MDEQVIGHLEARGFVTKAPLDVKPGDTIAAEIADGSANEGNVIELVINEAEWHDDFVMLRTDRGTCAFPDGTSGVMVKEAGR